jgi:hypothetical protein
MHAYSRVIQANKYILTICKNKASGSVSIRIGPTPLSIFMFFSFRQKKKGKVLGVPKRVVRACVVKSVE